MAKVTMRREVAAASEGEASARTDETTDARGRVLRIKRPGALDKMRLFGIIGGELANNQPYLGYAMLAFSVSHIDGQPCEPAMTRRTLEAKVDQLGDDGIDAVAKFMAPEAEEAPNPEA